ncbi:MAG: copper resistance protein NlpE N-terminal domain-containing protein, partial [Flavisolibacter sp.]
MKTFLVLLILGLMAVISWHFVYGEGSSEPVSETIVVTDTMVIVKDSVINAKGFDTTPFGFYQGMLPCKNCEGIQRTIVFSKNHFKMEELNWGKSPLAKITVGTWEHSKGKFTLYQNEKVLSTYRLVKDSLINVENNGTRIPDSLSKLYVLFKKNTPPENLSWNKRKSEGIDIIGTGGDPYWSIEIDHQKFIFFKLAASAKPIIVPIEKPVITKDSIVYSIATDGGSMLKIAISSKFCS